jgi:CelD/BcsL family acetyltransferase involved in cellulose biosynthesis
MTADYDIQRLPTGDVPRVERLIRRVPRTSAYAALATPAETLRQAEATHTNLSLGLYDGSALAGYILSVLVNAAESLRALGAPNVPDDFSTSAVFVVDCAVDPKDRAAATKLLIRFSRMLSERDDLRPLPLFLACADDLATRLARRPRFFQRLGFRLAQRIAFAESGTSQARNVLVFERLHHAVRNRSRSVRDALRSLRTLADGNHKIEVGLIETTADWALLEPHWNRLLVLTRGATALQTYDYQRIWWSHLGTACDLWIIVVLKDGLPTAIAPLQLSLLRWLGQDLRCLSFIGSAPESDRPRVLAAADSADSVRAVVEFIAARAGEWDHLFLAEQPPDDAFHTALAERLRAAGHSILQSPGLACPVVSLQSTWPEFLSRKTRAFRKSLKRKTARLAEAGPYRFENVQPGESPQQHLERYLAVERASWKAGTAAGVAQSSALVGFYRNLVARFAVRGGLEFHFLSLNDRTIAATFGLVWNDCFYSLHVAHDDAFADFSPGVILTSFELQDAFERQSIATFDFLSGTPANKAGWSTAVLPSVDLLCTCGPIRGRLFHLIYFRMKPRLRRLLIRWKLHPWLRRLKASLGVHDDMDEEED